MSDGRKSDHAVENHLPARWYEICFETAYKKYFHVKRSIEEKNQPNSSLNWCLGSFAIDITLKHYSKYSKGLARLGR